MEKIIQLTPDNIDKEHICCAISDKKCLEGYTMKKEWLREQFDHGYIFRRLDARAKVFIEYVPAERSWVPVVAPNYFFINCFWVSGQYKGQGYGKKLLKLTMEDARTQEKDGLVTVAGTKKLHFMSDTKWLLRQGFETTATLNTGFSLLTRKIKSDTDNIPKFSDSAISGKPECISGLVVYYSNRCPFTEFHVKTNLKETAEKRKLPLQIIKLETMEQARSAPTPATIFSLFYNGEFITTDVSVCMDSRFDKIMGKRLKS